MEKFDYIIQDQLGLHARPAGMLVKIAQRCGSQIQVLMNGKTADAKRLFALMSLSAKKNDRLTFMVEGEKEHEDCMCLKAFCQAHL